MKDDGGDSLESLRSRTKRFALGAISMFTRLPPSEAGRMLGRQLLRSATSVGAHYREASRARSNAEFVSKLEVGLQELDESGYWLELLIESNVCDSVEVRRLLDEVDEMTRIFVTIVRQRKGR